MDENEQDKINRYKKWKKTREEEIIFSSHLQRSEIFRYHTSINRSPCALAVIAPHTKYTTQTQRVLVKELVEGRSKFRYWCPVPFSFFLYRRWWACSNDSSLLIKSSHFSASFSCPCKVVKMESLHIWSIKYRLITKLITKLVCKLRDESNEPN